MLSRYVCNPNITLTLIVNRGAGSNLGQGGGAASRKKGTLFYFGKQAEKPKFKK